MKSKLNSASTFLCELFILQHYVVCNCVKRMICPIEWIADNTALLDIPNICRGLVGFYWPPWKNTRVSRAKNDCQDTEFGWCTYKGRILSTASEKNNDFFLNFD
jgi:hypothetical protein